MRPDPSWLDQQYNNRARIPEHPSIFARWQADSALARVTMLVHTDLRYGDDPGEQLDLFPAAKRGAPVLVFIHGGYWRSLGKADHSFVAPPFVDAGAMVVVPDYDLCPAATIERIALQMTHALAWVWRHAAEHGGDAQRIVVAGHSAGAHLAAMLLCCDWPRVAADLPVDLLQSAVGISGLYELESIRRTPFLQTDLRLTVESARRLSPAEFPPPAGRLVAVVGGDESEEFGRQNRLIRERWGERAVPVCEAVAGRHHLNMLDEWTARGSRLHARTLDLLGLA